MDRSRYPFRDEAVYQWDRLAELYGPVDYPEPLSADADGNYPAITVTTVWDAGPVLTVQ